LIHRVLQFASIERSQHRFQFASSEMPAVVDEAVKLFREHSPDADIEIEVNQAQHISRIRMDRSAIIEVFLNLLSNAEKYSRGSPRRIVVNLRETIDHIAVDVVDNGIGISKRDQRRIFEKFFRAQDYLTREVEGTGLGLSFARYIARIHKGDIKVSSTPGYGSTFTLELKKDQVLAE
jgi:two-component system phosphate regulon sensor histidine kinase PhoR